MENFFKEKLNRCVNYFKNDINSSENYKLVETKRKIYYYSKFFESPGEENLGLWYYMKNSTEDI